MLDVLYNKSFSIHQSRHTYLGTYVGRYDTNVGRYDTYVGT